MIITVGCRWHGWSSSTVQAGISSRNFGRVETRSLLAVERLLVVIVVIIVNDIFGGYASPWCRGGRGCHYLFGRYVMNAVVLFYRGHSATAIIVAIAIVVVVVVAIVVD